MQSIEECMAELRKCTGNVQSRLLYIAASTRPRKRILYYQLALIYDPETAHRISALFCSKRELEYVGRPVPQNYSFCDCNTKQEILDILIDDDVDAMRLLLSHDINHNRVSLLDWAAEYGSVACYRFLDINHATGHDLDLAVAGGNLEIMQLLIEKGFSFEDKLPQAIAWFHNELAERLLELYDHDRQDMTSVGKSLNYSAALLCISQGVSFGRALQMAISNLDSDLALFLFHSGAQMTDEALVMLGRTALMPVIDDFAAQNGGRLNSAMMTGIADGYNWELFERFIHSPVDSPAILRVIQDRRLDVLQHLHEVHPSKCIGNIFVNAAISADSLEIFQFVRSIGNQGYNTDAEYSPLVVAVKKNNIAIIKLLLEDNPSSGTLQAAYYHAETHKLKSAPLIAAKLREIDPTLIRPVPNAPKWSFWKWLTNRKF